MPHFGLMDEEALGPEQAPLQRARLHIRGGKRRLRQGKISAGILTLYDALVFGMEWYIVSPGRREKLTVQPGEDLRNDRTLYSVLVRSGVIDGSFDYPAFDLLVEYASNNEMPDYDYRELLASIESIMMQLGIMPFDEAELPAEDPATF
ncbi:MAG: hypothetical protein M0024_00120 [Nitrospiraceae bacterium]|nr:hypothetical protein [Nitrospiraceae bacterium]